jgi:GR25 family glycosyltransferase involved in LPS biosynthesis
MLNNFFDAIYCINLDRRPDRWDESVDEFKKWGIEGFERFSAYDGQKIQRINNHTSSSEQGLVFSNIDILKDAIGKGHKSILVLEDDFVFTPDFCKIQDLLKDVPQDWDLLYFGGNHNGHKGIIPPEKITNNLVKVHYTFAAHAVGINSKFFEPFLNKITSFSSALDVMLTELQKSHNAYCFSPSIAKQRPGYSDIQERSVDYSAWIK